MHDEVEIITVNMMKYDMKKIHLYMISGSYLPVLKLFNYMLS